MIDVLLKSLYGKYEKSLQLYSVTEETALYGAHIPIKQMTIYGLDNTPQNF